MPYHIRTGARRRSAIAQRAGYQRPSLGIARLDHYDPGYNHRSVLRAAGLFGFHRFRCGERGLHRLSGFDGGVPTTSFNTVPISLAPSAVLATFSEISRVVAFCCCTDAATVVLKSLFLSRAYDS